MSYVLIDQMVTQFGVLVTATYPTSGTQISITAEGLSPVSCNTGQSDLMSLRIVEDPSGRWRLFWIRENDNTLYQAYSDTAGKSWTVIS